MIFLTPWLIPFGGNLFVTGASPRPSGIMVAFFLFGAARNGLACFPLWVLAILVLVWSGGSQILRVVINIYSKCDPIEKRALWRDLLLRRISLGGNIWCVLRDFNFVCSPSKRVGGDSFEHRVGDSLCVELSNSISQMNLWYLPLIGRSFTWFQPRGKIVSRLDKIVISKDLWEL